MGVSLVGWMGGDGREGVNLVGVLILAAYGWVM